MHVGITAHLTSLAVIQMLDGAIADALGTIEDALRANPEGLLFRPETEYGGSNRETAALQKPTFYGAIALAQKMSAKVLELRATTSLARLLRDTNRRDVARAMLADINNWFTEGFDTSDLKDAKALLNELGAGEMNSGAQTV
jgi:hypothetical protein